MICATQAKKIMLCSNKEKERVIVEASIDSAILDSKKECQINFRISYDTFKWLKSYGYNIILTESLTYISW